MFQLSIKKDKLLTPLLSVAGAVDKRHSLVILSHFLFQLSGEYLFITATDLEIEISAKIACQSENNSSKITVPAKKFIDIIRSLNDEAVPALTCDNNMLVLKEGRSTFRLATLPAEEFPVNDNSINDIEISLPRNALIQLLQSTHFAMSQQDVRIFLNGLLLEFNSKSITAVATDGHRMAINKYTCENESHYRFLLPRKGVHELLRILHLIEDENVLLSAGKGHLSVATKEYNFFTKLLDARYPPYAKAIPQENDKSFVVDCELFKRAISRTIILSHEKYRSILLHMQSSMITLIANNQEHEEAEESLEALTEGEEIKVGLNAHYVLDVLNFFTEGQVKFSLSTTDNSILIESPDNPFYQYILMPMKI